MHALIPKIIKYCKENNAYSSQCARNDSDPSEFRYPTATPEDIMKAEQKLGFSLPPLLRDMYLNIANGGFGPGYGMGGVAPNGNMIEEKKTLAENYIFIRQLFQRCAAKWPEYLLPIASRGCNMFSCIDCKPGGMFPVYWYDPVWDRNRVRLERSFRDESKSFDEWINDWILGKEHQPSGDWADIGYRNYIQRKRQRKNSQTSSLL